MLTRIFCLNISREGKEVLRLLGRVATYSLSSTGLFYGQITPYLDHQDNLEWFKH